MSGGNRPSAVDSAKVTEAAARIEQPTSAPQLRRAQTFAVSKGLPGGATSAPPRIKRPASVALIKSRCRQPTLHIRLGETEGGRTEPLRDQGNAVTSLTSLVLQCAERGASIFASLDGSDPALAAEAHTVTAEGAADEAVGEAAARAIRDTAGATEAPGDGEERGTGPRMEAMGAADASGERLVAPARPISAQGIFVHTIPVPWPDELHGPGAPVEAATGSSGSAATLTGGLGSSSLLPSFAEAEAEAEAEGDAEAKAAVGAGGALEEAGEAMGEDAGAHQGRAGAAERAVRCRGPQIEVRAAAACDGRRQSLVVVSQRFRVVDERPALLALFDALGGKSWLRQRHWGHGSDRPIDQWEGVVVQGGWVVALELEDNHVSGALPQCIGQLERLERLSLGYNKVGGVIPASIGQCTKLRQLLLHDNRLSGRVPQLQSCAELEQVFLHNNDTFDDIDQALSLFASHPNRKTMHYTF